VGETTSGARSGAPGP